MSFAERWNAAPGAPGITLRPASPDDREFLFVVYADSRAQEMARTGWDAASIDAFLREQFRLQANHYERLYPDAEFLVIQREDAPIGRLYLCEFADRIQFMDIALLSAERGRGVGTAAIRAIQAHAHSRAKPVRLFVEDDNPAARLYFRLDFRKVGHHGIYSLLEWSAPAEEEY